MKLHTVLAEDEIRACLTRAKQAGRITADVGFTICGPALSRTHRHGYEIQLGTHDKNSLPAGTTDRYGKNMRVRRYQNSGTGGAGSVYAATWHEWGWLIAEIFKADPESRWGADPARARHPWGYFDAADFHEKTEYVFDDDGIECPADPEPFRPDPNPQATTHAMLSPAETLAQVDDTLAGYWHPNHP